MCDREFGEHLEMYGQNDMQQKDDGEPDVSESDDEKPRQPNEEISSCLYDDEREDMTEEEKEFYFQQNGIPVERTRMCVEGKSSTINEHQRMCRGKRNSKLASCKDDDGVVYYLCKCGCNLAFDLDGQLFLNVTEDIPNGLSDCKMHCACGCGGLYKATQVLRNPEKYASFKKKIVSQFLRQLSTAEMSNADLFCDRRQCTCNSNENDANNECAGNEF